MNLNKQIQSLPLPDGTTSTNYGPPFEVSSTALFMLRSCKQNKTFTLWINYTEYEPWDDIVAKIDGRVVCVQLKHNEKLDKKKLESCLNSRKALLDKHSRDSIIFLYFATTPDDGVRSKYPALTTVPDILNLFLTTKTGMYFDENSDLGETYFCMNQHNISNEGMDIKQALVECIGQQLLSEDHLKDIQTKFLAYVQQRYLRLLKGTEPLTDHEIRRQLAYTVLSKFKVEYKANGTKVEVSNNMEKIMETSDVVVFNHRWSSAFKEQIWFHLMMYLEKDISKKHLKQSKLDDLWMEGKLHMPLLSPSKETDKVILRALEIGGFEPKVLILRPRTFTIREGQDVITLLENLNVTEDLIAVTTGNDQENFKFAKVDLCNLTQNRNIKLHQDTFSKIAKDYFKGSKNYLHSLVEAQDEYNYVNDFNVFGSETLSALFAAIRIKNIDLKIIQRLIELGANVNASILGGFRPIFYAMDEDRADIVELLLQNGADPNPADKDGIRPLFKACIQNKCEIVDLLIKHKADRNTSDVDGVRPLFMAYNQRHFGVMRLLLKDFDKPAAANTLGSHILHKAAEDGSIECLRCVVECCPNMKIFMTGDVLGKTPLDIARENGHQEFVEILQNALDNN